MFYYKIKVQFMKAGAPLFSEDWVWTLVEDAIEHYNSRSLIAANPKQIVEHSLEPDGRTLNVVLESKAELQEAMASKALRVFSSYLISGSEDHNLSGYIMGKRLFKMLPSRLDAYVPPDHRGGTQRETVQEDGGSEWNTEEELPMIEAFLGLLKDARRKEDSREKVRLIQRILEGSEEEEVPEL